MSTFRVDRKMQHFHVTNAPKTEEEHVTVQAVQEARKDKDSYS